MEESNENKNVNRDEIRRLQKAARDGNKQHLIDWFIQFENQVKDYYDRELRKRYEVIYKEELNDSISNFIVAIVYTLHFNDKLKFGNKRIKEFIDDLFVTVEMFKLKQYTPEEYKQILEKEGINIFKPKEEK